MPAAEQTKSFFWHHQSSASSNGYLSKIKNLSKDT